MSPPQPTADDVCRLLCELGVELRDLVVAARGEGADLSSVTGRTTADTIYAVDRLTDDRLIGWFEDRWPGTVEVVTEGLDEPVVVGDGDPSWTCIVDTIDGTRGLMYDKRPAWVLAAAAPRGAAAAPTHADLVVAAMTEVPTAKQWGSDQLSGVRGQGVVAERHDVRGSALPAPLTVRPSAATDLEHGWSSFARFFPQGKVLLARFEDVLWRELYGEDRAVDLGIFDDQYLSTGGQLHELLAGHDRLLGDLRPLAFAELGMSTALACHPYDVCTALLAEEAGCVVTDPWGAPLAHPLDTTTPVAWVGFANEALAEWVRPAIAAALREVFPLASRP